jgi:hypothetical protein
MQGRQNIIYQYLVWQFFNAPVDILKGWQNYLLFNFNYFSIQTLAKTFFSHWRRYASSYGKGFSPSRYFEAFIFNMMSRIIGAILRTFFIIAGILIEVFIAFAGGIVFIVWIILPFLVIFGFIFGLRLLIF